MILDRLGRRKDEQLRKGSRGTRDDAADLVEVEPVIGASCTHELDASRSLNEVVAMRATERRKLRARVLEEHPQLVEFVPDRLRPVMPDDDANVLPPA